MGATFFFDSPKILAFMNKAEARAQSKFGAYVRTRARSSLRRRKKTSAPGSPPSVHSTDEVATLKNIRFAFDPKKRSTVVGPLALNMVDRLNGQMQRGVAPRLHEFGGVRGVLEVRWPDGRWLRYDQRRKFGDYATWPKRMRTAKYPPRPFMAPALASERSKFPDFFRASLRAA